MKHIHTEVQSDGGTGWSLRLGTASRAPTIIGRLAAKWYQKVGRASVPAFFLNVLRLNVRTAWYASGLRKK